MVQPSTGGPPAYNATCKVNVVSASPAPLELSYIQWFSYVILPLAGICVHIPKGPDLKPAT